MSPRKMKLEGPISDDARLDIMNFIRDHDEDCSLLGLVDLLITTVNNLMFQAFDYKDKEQFVEILMEVYKATVDTDAQMYDKMVSFKELAMAGKNEA